ncbi:MAG: hypothetical protein LBB93_05615 [Elusimicrobiota bacterium]|jgi:hypothetical protein|nr:hypothetical protein [Elusimicrobiota bacterium]
MDKKTGEIVVKAGGNYKDILEQISPAFAKCGKCRPEDLPPELRAKNEELKLMVEYVHLSMKNAEDSLKARQLPDNTFRKTEKSEIEDRLRAAVPDSTGSLERYFQGDVERLSSINRLTKSLDIIAMLSVEKHPFEPFGRKPADEDSFYEALEKELEKENKNPLDDDKKEEEKNG